MVSVAAALVCACRAVSVWAAALSLGAHWSTNVLWVSMNTPDMSLAV